jgi:hypothetical protein
VAAKTERIDVVVMWVDDRWPGYHEVLAAHSGDPRDLNPNRTRDNLGLLRYGLRSLERYMPNLGKVFLFTMRPQVPAWLDTTHPDVVVVHHDEVMDAAILPTFNSFAILSHVHFLPGLSQRFLFLEDDMMLAAATAAAELGVWDGQMRLIPERGQLPAAGSLDPARASPWNLALAKTAETLSHMHGRRRWPRLAHAPLAIDRQAFSETMARYADAVAATRAARFRSAACVVPEVLFPLDRWASGAADLGTASWHRPLAGYASLENLRPWTWLQLRVLDWRAPQTLCLNDSFGQHPNPKVEAMIARWLERRYPRASRFERAAMTDS